VDKLKLTNVTQENYVAVVNLLMVEAMDRTQEYLMAYQKNPKRVMAVVHEETGEIYNLFYPESSSGAIVRMHTILSEKGRKCKEAQFLMYREYLESIFSEHYVIKIVVTVSERYRLIQKLTESFGFVLEGRHRKEDGGTADMLYYGLLREEFRNGR
jgi:hypothetical protein